MRIIKYNEFVNEIFGFGKLKYDDLAKSTLSKLLDNINNVEVHKFADYKREVTISLENEKSDNSKEKIDSLKERRVEGLKKSVSSIPFNPKKNVRDIIKSIDYSKVTKIEVMKNYSKHRTSSKMFGVFDENTYTLSINGKHFVSDIRGEEGKSLVSNKITKLFWNLLTELEELQANLKKKLIEKDEYDTKVSELKNKYSKLI